MNALERLLEQNVLPGMSAAALQNSNDFRRENCYVPAVDAELRAQEINLRAIFAAYTSKSSTPNTSSQIPRLMDYAQFLEFLSTIRFFSNDLSVREATLIFVWSRMRVIPQEDDMSEIRNSQMTFFDFLEAMVRVSMCKSLPLEERFEDLPSVDVHAFMVNVQVRSFLFLTTARGDWDKFVATHSVKPGIPPLQPVQRCLKLMMSLIVSTIRTVTSSPGAPGEA
ncbi:MAG: hypothetical protein SGPRY_005296 [Prymnesium sp.]